MPTIYILKCEQNRYYIGKTERSLDSRIKEHFLNNGSEWTRKYKPIKLIDTIQNADDFDEDKYTKIYMKKYGINNVRGGSYTQINLPEYSIISLEKELCSASNLCFRCNREGHFASKCYASKRADGTHISDDDTNDEKSCFECKYCDEYFDTEYKVNKHETKCKYKNICFRCDRAGHNINKCYASKKADGTHISDDDDSYDSY